MAIKTYYLGTSIKITIKLSVATPTTCTIDIFDSSNVKKVTAAAMTKEDDYIYSYIFQSTTSYNEGTWTATFTVVSGGYTAYTESQFEMLDETD